MSQVCEYFFSLIFVFIREIFWIPLLKKILVLNVLALQTLENTLKTVYNRSFLGFRPPIENFLRLSAVCAY